MKLRLLTVLLLCAVALSCANESVERQENDKTAEANIRFATEFNTRGSIIDDPAGLAARGGFTVWAYTHTDRWASSSTRTPLSGLSGGVVTGNAGGTIWSYGEPVNWPDDRFVSFFAYAPAGSGASYSMSSDMPTLSFTVGSNPTTHTDLLVAAPLYDRVGAAYSSGNPVIVNFKRALSRIRFSGVLASAETRTIKVKQIILGGLYDSGTTALDPLAWTVSGNADNSYTLNIAGNHLGDIALTTTPVMLSNPSGHLFLMPQDLVRGADMTPTMEMILEITDLNQPLGQQVKDVAHKSFVFSPKQWQAGKSYDYRIVIDGEDVKILMIESELELAEWNVNLMIQPIYMLNLTLNAGDDEIARIKFENEKRIYSAISVFSTLNGMETTPNMPINSALYYAIYITGNMETDINIDMDADAVNNVYNSFKAGTYLIFDVEKSVWDWGNDGDATQPANRTFTVDFDANEWELSPSRQPYPDVDATTSATTPFPNNYLKSKGSIILLKKDSAK